MKNLTLLLLVVFALSSCKKKSNDDDDNNQTNNPPANAIYYWYCNLDGAAKNFYYATGQEDCSISLGNDDDISTSGDTSSFRYSGSIGLATANVPYFSIKRGTLILPNGGTPSEAEENAFWQNPVVTYSPDAVNGIEIVYFDAQGMEWSTSKGPQTTSTFTFTAITPYDLSYIGVHITATFKCTLFNAAGLKKELTNGKAKLDFQSGYN